MVTKTCPNCGGTHHDEDEIYCGNDCEITALREISTELLNALENADKLITLLMPGIKHIVLQDYGFLNQVCMDNRAVIAKAKGDSHA